MSKSWFSIKAAEKGAAAEVAIRGLIGEWGVTDRDFIAQVQALGDVEDLTVRINSRGGEVDHAVGIFNFLRDHPADVHVIVDGVAMSSGSLIAMAGDRITMRANAVMMIHNPWTYAAGNARQLRNQADILEKFEAALAAIYVARTGKKEDDIKKMLDGPEGDGIYMTAAEAKAEGFADDIEAIGTKGAQAAAMAMATALGIPADVLAKIEAAEAEGEGSTDDPAAGSDTPDTGADQQDAQPTDALADQINAAAVAAGLGDFAGVFALDGKINSLADAQAAITQAREVRALCVVAKLPDEAEKLIRARVSLAEARAKLCDILAAEDERLHTDSKQRQNSGKPAASGASVWSRVLPSPTAVQ